MDRSLPPKPPLRRVGGLIRCPVGERLRGTVTVGGRLLAVVEREHDATSENFDTQMPGRRR